jgi:hypothetical protein
LNQPDDAVFWMGRYEEASQAIVHLQEAIQAILNPVGPDNLA